MEAVFKHPCTIVISGPTMCGKSYFTRKLVEWKDSLIYPQPDNILWCYGMYQKSFEDLPGTVKFHEGLPSNLENFDTSRRTLVIIDDLLHETDDRVSKLFTKGSHHCNLSVIYITQNLFHASKQNRTLNLNTHYLVIFKNPRDATQISHIARQMYPGRSKFLVEAYADATQRPHGYLLIDLKNDTEEQLRVRTNVLPDEWPHYVYVHK